MNSSGVKAVLPGAMRTVSMPSSTSTGQMRSTSAQAMNRVPSDTEGAARFATKATAKWPINIDSSCLARQSQQGFLEILLHRLVAEPDAQQRAVEVLAFDGRPGGFAVDQHLGRLAVPFERDGHSLLRFLDLGHGARELLHLRLERLGVGLGMVGADSVGQRFAELLGAHVAQHADLDP